MKTSFRNKPNRTGRIRFTSALPYFILTGTTILFFWEIIIRRYFLWEDILYQYYPFNFFLFKNLRHFTIPLWNPYMFAGMPFLADIQTQVFYPINWLLAFISNSNQIDVFWLVELKCILHILLGAIGFYLLMREMKLSHYSGIVSGIIFGFSGFMVMHIIHLTLISTFAWFPLILLFFYRTLSHRRLSDAAGAAIALGLANLAGHPQMTLHIVYALAFFFLTFLIFNWRNERIILLSRHLPLFFFIIFFGFALSAAAYLPAYRYSLYTVRERMTYIESAETSLPPWFLITILIPKFFGSIAGGTVETVPFWGEQTPYTYWETCFYTGVTSLVLAGVGLLFSRNRLRWSFFLLAIIALLLALGKFTPVYRLAFTTLPGFNRFRIPARFVDLFVVAVAFLAGLGMEVFLNLRKPNPRILLPGLYFLFQGAVIMLLLITGALRKFFPLLENPIFFANSVRQTAIMLVFLLAVLTLLWFSARDPKRNKICALVLTALAFFDLYIFGKKFSLGTTSPEQFYPHRLLISQLATESKSEPFRINARSGSNMIFQRNEGLLWDLELLEGYTPLKLVDYVNFDIPVHRRNDLLNVKYYIQVDSIHNTLRLALNSSSLPRVWLVDSCIVLGDRKAILALLADSNFDYHRAVILEKEPVPAPHSAPDSTALGSVNITRRTPDLMKLEVENHRPAILTFSEIYYPEWKARVNGKPAEIMRANYCLRAIALPAGKHNVTIWYDRTFVDSGIAVSLFALAGLILILIMPKQKATQRK